MDTVNDQTRETFQEMLRLNREFETGTGDFAAAGPAESFMMVYAGKPMMTEIVEASVRDRDERLTEMALNFAQANDTTPGELVLCVRLTETGIRMWFEKKEEPARCEKCGHLTEGKECAVCVLMELGNMHKDMSTKCRPVLAAAAAVCDSWEADDSIETHSLRIEAMELMEAVRTFIAENDAGSSPK